MATLVTDNNSNNNNNAEEPVLSTKFIKQNKPRIFNLYTSSLKITFKNSKLFKVCRAIDSCQSLLNWRFP